MNSQERNVDGTLMLRGHNKDMPSDMIARAQLQVACNATDADDLLQLLQMLGIDEKLQLEEAS